MEFFRWILILTGIALLVVTYLLGRRKVDSVDYRRRLAEQDSYDPSVDDLSVPISTSTEEYDSTDDDNVSFKPIGYQEGEEFLSDDEIDDVLPVKTPPLAANDAEDMGIEETDPPVAKRSMPVGKVKSFANAVKQASQRKSKAPANSMAEEFEPYQEARAFEPEEKLVTLHITSRDGKFNGNELKQAFERHGYSFGKMSIYHCSHEKQKVFAVANMVKPGTFDLDNIADFQTPGITLFMRLPVALDADVAFEFLLREAQELSGELDGQLRDADRNTLTPQTIQHMLEDIQQYSFRQKSLAHA